MHSTTKSPEPLGHFNVAHSYWKAAEALAGSDWRAGVSYADRPVRFLYWHAIKLFLKACLLSEGMDEVELKRKFSHDIKKLSQSAKDSGLALGELEMKILASMPTQNDMSELRYLVAGLRRGIALEDVGRVCGCRFFVVGQTLQKRGVLMGPHSAHFLIASPIQVTPWGEAKGCLEKIAGPKPLDIYPQVQFRKPPSLSSPASISSRRMSGTMTCRLLRSSITPSRRSAETCRLTVSSVRPR